MKKTELVVQNNVENIPSDVISAGSVDSAGEEILSAMVEERLPDLKENQRCSLFFEEKPSAKGDGVKIRHPSLDSDYSDKTVVRAIIDSRISAMNRALKEEEGLNGPLGIFWSGIKNFFNFGASSEQIYAQIETEGRVLKEKGLRDGFYEITGELFTESNFKKFHSGELCLRSEQMLAEYRDGQNSFVDLCTDAMAGICALGVLSVLATGGISTLILAGGAALLTGGLVKPLVKSIDSAIGGREYDTFRNDFLIGAFSGIIGLVAGICGGALGAKFASKLGVRAVGRFRGGKGLVNSLKNTLGHKYVGGTSMKRAAAKTVEAMTDGSLGGGLDEGFRALTKGDNFKNILKNSGKGFVYGLAFSPIIGGGMEVMGQTLKYLKEPTLITTGEYSQSLVQLPIDEKTSAVMKLSVWQKIVKRLQDDTITPEDVRDILSDDFIEENFLTGYAEAIKRTVPNKSHVLDLNSQLSARDYEMIATFVNKQDSKYLDKWLKFEKGVDNMQKLAQFARVQQLTGKQRLYFGMNDAEWSVVVDGITDRPEEVAQYLYAYKKDSRDINEAITKPLYEVPPKLQDAIEGITKFIDKSAIKEPIKVYRGEGHYGLFSQNVTISGKNLGEELERVAQLIDAKILDEEQIASFVEKELKCVPVIQERFLSTAMDISPAEEYAKTVLWDIEVPKGTKGVQIEPYNVERKAEDEFLIQRGSKLLIKNAKYDKTRKLWLLSAIIEQEN